jgi:hypothetical protein
MNSTTIIALFFLAAFIHEPASAEDAPRVPPVETPSPNPAHIWRDRARA